MKVYKFIIMAINSKNPKQLKIKEIYKGLKLSYFITSDRTSRVTLKIWYKKIKKTNLM